MNYTEEIKSINEFLKKSLLEESSAIKLNTLKHVFKTPEIKELFTNIIKLVDKQNVACNYAKALSTGDLNQEVPKEISFIDPLKNLQSNLKHLVWQINCLADGDYDQEFMFWGELSDAFNKLKQTLKTQQKYEIALEESERNFKLIIENSLDIIWILDLKTLKFKYISPSVIQMRGLTVEEAIQEPLHVSLYGESYKRAMVSIQNALQKAEMGLPTYTIDEYQQKCKDGKIIDIEISANFICDKFGKPKEILGVTRDITRRKKVEILLKESQEQLKNLLAHKTIQNIKLTQQLNYIFENTIDAIAFFEFDDNTINFLESNTKWLNIFKLEKEKVIGKNIKKIFDEETTFIIQKYINWIVDENNVIDDITNWRDRQFQIKAIPIKNIDNKITSCAIFINDITEKQHVISKLKTLENQLTYTGLIVETRERRKLATDLHDNVGPLLSSMNMYLSSLARKPEIEPYSELIINIRRILKETMTSVREISNNISPQILNTFGLTAALNFFFETKQNIIELKIDNNLDNFRFSEAKEVMLYNIIKEAYNNSIKYSNATLITLYINKNENVITTIYSDNGIGFNLEEKLASASQSMGLLSIINRIKNLGGIYEIKSSPGNGFYLEINFLSNI